MRMISQIFISGNALSGSLPYLNRDKELYILSLSSNHLTGTIPDTYLTNIVKSVDLSTNRINGVLPDYVNTNLSIDFTVNRLSGRVPRIYKSLANVDILDGNLITCDSNNDLPPNDDLSSQYSCGSNQLNYSLYAWIATGFTAAVILLITRKVLNLRRTTRIRSSSDRTELKTIQKNSTVSSIHNYDSSYSISQAVISGNWDSLETLIRYYRTGLSLANHSELLGKSSTLEKPSSSSSRKNGALKDLPRFSDGTGLMHKLFFDLMYSKDGQVSELSKFMASLILIRSIAAILALSFVLFYMPLYLILSLGLGYSTHAQTYGWVITSAFISGELPSILFVIFWTLTVLFFMRIVDVSNRVVFGVADHQAIALPSVHNRNLSVTTVNWQNSRTFSKESILLLLSSSGILLLNFTLVLLINVAYVLILVAPLSATIKVISQWMLSLWKVLWNSFGVPAIFYLMKGLGHDVKVLVFVGTLYFNNIAAVLIATALTSKSCFVGINLDEDYDTLVYEVPQCTNLNLALDICSQFVIVDYKVIFRIPYVYNYSCTSAILRAYIPIIFYVYSVTAFFQPLFYMLLSRLKSSSIPRWLIRYMPAVLWPNEVIPGKDRPFHPNNVINHLLGHMMVLMTFGVTCPPLAVAIAVTIIILTTMWIILVGRFVDCKYSESSSPDLSIDHHFSGCWTSLLHVKWGAAFGIALFYMVMIFDIAGDEMGAGTASAYSTSILFFLILFYTGGNIFQQPWARKIVRTARLIKFPAIVLFILPTEVLVVKLLNLFNGGDLCCRDEPDVSEESRMSEMIAFSSKPGDDETDTPTTTPFKRTSKKFDNSKIAGVEDSNAEDGEVVIRDNPMHRRTL
jgi:hypothetical protein